MQESEQLSALIAEIYDAVLDRSLWPVALKKATNFLQGHASAIYWNDAANNSGDVFFDDGGIDPDFRQLYFQKYVALNPTLTPRLFAAVEEPVATADLVPYEEFLKTRFYREWAKPQGLVDFVSIFLEKAALKAAMFGVFRHQRQGVVSQETRRRMCLIAPHLRRAAAISKFVNLQQASLTEAMDGLRAGVFVVDASGNIIFSNRAAKEIVRAGDYLRGSGGRLSARQPEANQLLQEAFQSAVDGDAAIGDRSVAIPLLATDGTRYVANLLPLSERRAAGIDARATVAVFVQKAVVELPNPPEVIASAYQLTKAELRVLLALVQLGGAPEVAETLGIGRGTVKTHLSNIFQKTGTKHQADLVKLVAGFSGSVIADTDFIPKSGAGLVW